MSVDKLVDSTQLDSDLTSVANAIRTKGGTSASLAFPSGFVSAINAISGGGGSGAEHGTVTPTARTTTVSFDAGLSTIAGILIVPHSESPFKSGGKTCFGIIATPNCIYRAVALTSNNAGSAMLTPASSTTMDAFSLSGTTVTVYSSGNSHPNGGFFEAITYDWWAW